VFASNVLVESDEDPFQEQPALIQPTIIEMNSLSSHQKPNSAKSQRINRQNNLTHFYDSNE